MPATQESPNERRRLYAELWISFTALIRSYVAAHDLAMPVAGQAQVEEIEPGRLALRVGSRTLALEFDSDRGAGSWTVHENEAGADGALERGSFEMDENSRVALSDRPGKLELEVAAEAFTAKVFD